MRTRSQTIKVKNLNESAMIQLFSIFEKYYSETSFDIFKKDLMKKDYIILVKDLDRIVGFSTILVMKAKIQGEKLVGVFTGDTIVEKEYWGANKLGLEFSKVLFKTKLMNPGKNIYWFLISKGYKTYLTLANNFAEHYPRYEKATPKDKKMIIDYFARTIGENSYIPEKGIIRFENIYTCLKKEIAPITKEMKAKNQRINYFDIINPGWRNGEELCCIGRLSAKDFLNYSNKHLKKLGQHYYTSALGIIEKGNSRFQGL